MQHCEFCGSEFPEDTRFCGRCGRAPRATLDAPTTLSSGQARPVPKKEAEEEEERRHRALLLDLSFSPGGAGSAGDAADERRADGAGDTILLERRTRSLSCLVERCPACCVATRATTGSTEWSTDGSYSSIREAFADGVAAPTARASPPRATRAASVWKAPCPPFRRVCPYASDRVGAQGAPHRSRRSRGHCGRRHYSGCGTDPSSWWRRDANADFGQAWYDHRVLPSYC